MTIYQFNICHKSRALSGSELMSLLSVSVFDFLFYFNPLSPRPEFSSGTNGLYALLYLDCNGTNAQESNTHEHECERPAQ